MLFDGSSSSSAPLIRRRVTNLGSSGCCGSVNTSATDSEVMTIRHGFTVIVSVSQA